MRNVCRILLMLILMCGISSLAKAQFSLKIGSTYLTNNHQSEEFGVCIEPQYQINKHVTIGISASFFFQNPFPDYYVATDANWNSTPNIICSTAHRIVPITANIKYSFLNPKQKLQPYLQASLGTTITGTFTNAKINNPSYFISQHEVNNFFTVGGYLGANYKLTHKFYVCIEGGYLRIMGDKKINFPEVPAELNNFTFHVLHAFHFSTALKFNF